MIKNVVPVITSSPWNRGAIKNFDQYAESAFVNRTLTFYRRKEISFIQDISPYRSVNTFQQGYKNQSVNDV